MYSKIPVAAAFVAHLVAADEVVDQDRPAADEIEEETEAAAETDPVDLLAIKSRTHADVPTDR